MCGLEPQRPVMFRYVGHEQRVPLEPRHTPALWPRVGCAMPDYAQRKA